MKELFCQIEASKTFVWMKLWEKTNVSLSIDEEWDENTAVQQVLDFD